MFSQSRLVFFLFAIILPLSFGCIIHPETIIRKIFKNADGSLSQFEPGSVEQMEHMLSPNVALVWFHKNFDRKDGAQGKDNVVNFLKNLKKNGALDKIIFEATNNSPGKLGVDIRLGKKSVGFWSIKMNIGKSLVFITDITITVVLLNNSNIVNIVVFLE